MNWPSCLLTVLCISPAENLLATLGIINLSVGYSPWEGYVRWGEGIGAGMVACEVGETVVMVERWGKEKTWLRGEANLATPNAQ